MDFNALDIDAFLRASFPYRFQDISPYDFEAFVALLFRRDGFVVRETGYSGDFGADLIVEKKGKTTAVQIKRYAADVLAGVNDIQQVIGACRYYNTDNALFITTSDFTAPAIAMAKADGVVLWNWQRLSRYISTVLMDGETYEDRFTEIPAELDEVFESPDAYFDFKLRELDDEELPEDAAPCIALHAEIRNTSGRNLTIHLDLPIVVSRKSGRQVSAVRWKDNYFFQGLLVSDAAVEIACLFLTAQISRIRRGDRILIRAHVSGQEQPVLIDEILGNPGRSCYIATYCYGRDSEEYNILIRFRDEVLMRKQAGALFVKWYYHMSPVVVRYMRSRRVFTAFCANGMRLLLALALAVIRLSRRGR